LKGFVLKLALHVDSGTRQGGDRAVPGIQSHDGAITLNHSGGRLNPVAVDIAGRSGAKIVWFPTVDAENETAGLPTGRQQENCLLGRNPNAKFPPWWIAPPRMTVSRMAMAKISARPHVSCIELIAQARHDPGHRPPGAATKSSRSAAHARENEGAPLVWLVTHGRVPFSKPYRRRTGAARRPGVLPIRTSASPRCTPCNEPPGRGVEFESITRGSEPERSWPASRTDLGADHQPPGGGRICALRANAAGWRFQCG